MTTNGRNGALAAAMALVLVGAPACAPLAALDGIGMPGGRTSLVQGEIRSIDQRRNHMQIRENNGRNQVVAFDNRTVVVSNQQRSRISALRRGDHVRVRVSNGYDRVPIADRVEVYGNAGGRGSAVRVERIDGRVGRVDTRRGVFTVDRGRSGTVLVHMPHRVQRNDERRFERLRRGERVRVEVRLTSRNQAEFVRFR